MQKQQRNIKIMCDALAKLLFYLLSLLFFSTFSLPSRSLCTDVPSALREPLSRFFPEGGGDVCTQATVALLVLKVPIFVRIWLFVVFSQCFWLVAHQDLSLNHIPEKCLENMVPCWKRQNDRHPTPLRKLDAVISNKFKASFQPFAYYVVIQT